MAFVPGFEHDIFISYAHLNDPVGEDGAARWVTRFHARLEAALRQLAGKPLVIWRDLNLERNQEFDKTIKTAVESSALFLTVNSLVYQASPYCQDEIKWFNDTAQADGYGVSVGDRRRLFHLLLNNIPFNEWHAAFAGTTGYDFFEIKPGKQVALPCDQGSKHFQTRLDDLVIDLFTTLQEFKRQAAKKAPLPPAPQPVRQSVIVPAESFSVFLADVSPELRRTVRKRLTRELQDKGVTIAPAVPPPMHLTPHDEKARAEMEAAQLCIHLFDDEPGNEIEGEDGVFYPQRQTELGLQLQRPQLIWTSPALDWQKISDLPHRAFLEGLRDGTRERANYNFVTTTQAADLASVILDRLAELKRAANATQPSSALLLDTHLKDEEYALTLRRLLTEGRVRSVINQWEDGPGASAETWAMLLRHMRRMLIVCGNVEMSWVLGRVGQALELANAETLPLKVGVYYAASQPKGNAAQQKFGALTLYHFDEADIRNPQAMQPLLADF